MRRAVLLPHASWLMITSAQGHSILLDSVMSLKTGILIYIYVAYRTLPSNGEQFCCAFSYMLSGQQRYIYLKKIVKKKRN
jgi:hypothetical protein